MVQIVEESIYRYLKVIINAGNFLYRALPISMPTRTWPLSDAG